jgi:zinc protease
MATSKVSEYRLDNGLRLLVKQDHRAPVVVSQIWYRVGSSYEHGGITGVSHVLEHMMFQGTKKHGPNEFSRIISENGGRENAFTGRDYTAYFQRLHKDRLPVSFELEADRMHNLMLQEKEFDKELKVVMEERRLRTEDKPGALTYESFNAAAFQSSPYHHPIIGWMNDLEHMKLDDLANWYRKWYVPDNAVLVVVGDVEPGEVYQLARQTYGKVPAGKPAKLKPRREVPQRGERRIQVKAPANQPSLYMGYKVPSLVTAEEPWEAYALEVLAGILDGGNSARIPRQLVRGQELAAGAGAGYDLIARLDSLFTFSGTPANGHTMTELEQALKSMAQELRDKPVEQAELQRVKAQVIAENVYERDSMFYQAMQMGQLESVGLSWQVADEYVDRIKAVTAQQVQQVAKKYLVDEHLTIAELVPDKAALNGHARSVVPVSGGGNVR